MSRDGGEQLRQSGAREERKGQNSMKDSTVTNSGGVLQIRIDGAPRGLVPLMRSGGFELQGRRLAVSDASKEAKQLPLLFGLPQTLRR